ncbi:hypothetical protein M2451_002020 [Dysgonomonas sp. PFB1-18]|uniref:hypothetical protein n=1 Tax=unclassified Dysgonomonas TaxID=2630389 RepID=UPI0024732079|nr:MULTISPECIES: hypothetical protein [unclassified Dysgonomonas]MDH6309796.1 hypothetical protein [Dysgonomonas sp. PF1-14]MDH6339196.1 hypothetical protein [Dysgonomonas sp. PF1-16]MDH6380695.1 hypothetical protein [Dysgonomonas sp. PFB1-18]MDH6398191.1 hypothetical protein [Dysgonomonas sp. PF1-23]
MKTSNISWLFVCYVQSERKFLVHIISVASFYKALTEHSSLFPAHNVVFALQVPVHLAEYTGRHFQSLFADSDHIYSEFAKCINTPMQSLIVTQVKTYQGLVPLTYSDANKRLSLSSWRGEYYESAQAFVLHVSLIEFFNSIFYVSSTNILNLFKNE